jgi:hypothetical protein
VAEIATPKRIGSDDMNGDPCIIFSGRFSLGGDFTKGFSKKK